MHNKSFEYYTKQYRRYTFQMRHVYIEDYLFNYDISLALYVLLSRIIYLKFYKHCLNIIHNIKKIKLRNFNSDIDV